MLVSWTTLAFLVVCFNHCVIALPIVELENGELEGSTMVTRRGKEYFAFQGIPYAVPPLGKLRFEPPKPAQPWTGVRQAVDHAPKCTQRNIMMGQKYADGQEDCLYLNVYTPRLNKTSEGKFLPVMVWIHGGAWISGSGSLYSPKFLLDHEVIMVSFNYRLGALGFLSTGDATQPGNMGMKDQVLALKWVQKNIHAFGGDPNEVTLFGQSAGASSVHYHMMSPLSRGLFHRAISQSGVALNPWAFDTPEVSANHSQRLAKHFNCSVESSKQLVECLRKKDATAIFNAEEIFQIFGYDPPTPFRITVEPKHTGAFLPESPLSIAERNGVANVPWLVGMNSHEGALRVASLFGWKDRDYVKELNDNWNELAPITLFPRSLLHNHTSSHMLNTIRKKYFNTTIDTSSKWTLIDLYTDALLASGVDAAIRYQLKAASSPIYYYNFAYVGSNSFTMFFGDTEGDYGVSHGDDLLYLFPLGEMYFPHVPPSDDDFKMIDYLTNAWTNFAKTGNPTPKITINISSQWMPIKSDAMEYLSINSPNNISMMRNLNEPRMKLWRNHFYEA